MVLLKAGLLPLVVDRGMRMDYIGALESADHGTLQSLVNIFAALEKNAILQALSLDVEAEQRAEKHQAARVLAGVRTPVRCRSLGDARACRQSGLASALRQLTGRRQTKTPARGWTLQRRAGGEEQRAERDRGALPPHRLRAGVR